MLFRELDVEIIEEFGQNIKRQMMELNLSEEDDIDIILDEQDSDYPENINKIKEALKNGKTNDLNVGDRVLLKYIMNTDGCFCGFAYRNARGIVTSIITDIGMIKVKFDSEELNEYGELWCPYSFIKM